MLITSSYKTTARWECCPMDEEVEMILTFVPEAEYMSYEDALILAIDRNKKAAYDLFIDIVCNVWRINAWEI